MTVVFHFEPWLRQFLAGVLVGFAAGAIVTGFASATSLAATRATPADG